MKLNLITGKVGELATEPIILPPKKFWEYYLGLLGVRNPAIELSFIEQRVLIEVLSRNPREDYFYGHGAKEIMTTLSIRKDRYTKIKKALIRKDFLKKNDRLEYDTRKIIFIPAIAKLQKYINKVLEKDSKISLEFVLPFKVVNEQP